MMNLLTKKLVDRYNNIEVVIYEEGCLAKPLVLLTKHQAEQLAKDILREVE